MYNIYIIQINIILIKWFVKKPISDNPSTGKLSPLFYLKRKMYSL